MKTKQDYLAHLEAAKAIETMLDLQQRGYKVKEQARVGNKKVDLIARKNDRTILFEFKSQGSAKPADKQLLLYAKKHGFEYRLVIVSPPERVEIEIEDLSTILYEHILNDLPQQLFDVASHPTIDDIVDIELTSLVVSKEEIKVKGRGVIEVTLRYGGGEERDGVTNYDDYPLEFELTLDHKLSIVSAEKLNVDVSSFFE